MKDEKERMQEFIKPYTNAGGDLPKNAGIDKTVHAINISLKTMMVIIVIIVILMLIPILAFVYSKTEVFFRMNKKDFIKRIEKTYGQKIEIIEDNSTVKGNGTYIFKTKKEPYITFNGIKISNTYEGYNLDFEENAFTYYFENSQDSVFDNITLEKSFKNYFGNYDIQFLSCNICLNIDSFNQIEQACKQRKQLQEWMKDKIKKFDVEIHLKIGDYTSYIWSYDTLDNLIYKEKYEYYWYLKNNGKDTSQISKEDLEMLNRPAKIEVLVNGKRVEDKEETENNILKSQYNIVDKNNTKAYLQATYNQETREYEMTTKSLLLNCNKFTILDKNTNKEFSFKYKDRIYKVHYNDGRVHGNKLPYMSKLSYFEEVFGAKLEYDYDNKKVNIQL